MVNFVAWDEDETGNPYAGVIPVEKAIDPFGDALLAYEMNGEKLPRDHGAPLRLVVPGHAGCRNVKWLKNISVTAKPSELDAGSKLDRHFAPDVSFENHIRYGDDFLRLDQGPAIQSAPVQSVICSPVDGATIPAAKEGGTRFIEMNGVAYSGGGRGIIRVEVSLDGGKNWQAAECLAPPAWTEEGKQTPPPNMAQGRHWGWTQWTVKLPMPAEFQGKLDQGRTVMTELCARAIDGDFNSQPEKMEQCWNALGICVNHWPRSKVLLHPDKTFSDDCPVLFEDPPAGYPKERDIGTPHSRKASTLPRVSHD